MYTTHGHQIAGTPVEGEPPESVARCGGPSLCYRCSIQAAQARNRLTPQEVLDNILDIEGSKPMEIEFQKYTRKPFTVEAVEITEENLEELAVHIGTIKTREEDGVKYIHVDRRLVPNVFRVFPGFFMTKMGDNIRCYSPRTFKEQFELLGTE